MNMPEQGLKLDYGHLIQDGKVHSSMYTSDQVFDDEMEAIFHHGWVFVGHDSEIPNPGDYVMRQLGKQPVVMTRDQDGGVNVIRNRCAHRANMVVGYEGESKKVLVCPYHGWVYNSSGKLLDIKDKDRGGFPEGYLDRDYDLVPVPHVQAHHGFIFASLNPNSPPLLEHLGESARFIEMFANESKDGLEVLRGRSTYTHRGNWKMQAENGVDGYHVDVVHASYFRLAAGRAKLAADAKGEDGFKAFQVNLPDTDNGNYDLGNGHVMIWTDIPNYRDRALGMQYDTLEERVGKLEAKWMAGRLRQVLIYPNLILFDGISTQLRSWNPIAVDKTEVYAVCVAPKGEPEEARERRIRQYEDFYGASGIATPDDLTEFDACQDGYNGRLAEWHDFDRGMGRLHLGADKFAEEVGITPVSSASDFADEALYHGEYRHWLETLTKGIQAEQETAHGA